MIVILILTYKCIFSLENVVSLIDYVDKRCFTKLYFRKNM